MAMGADPRLCAVFTCVAIGFDDKGTTGVVPGNSRHQLCVGVQGTWRFAIDGKIHKRGTGHYRFAVLPESFQFLLDLSRFD